MSAVFPVPGSVEELAAFARLQARLPALFERVFGDPLAPRTVVIVPGLSMDPDVLTKVVGGLHYEERQLAMLMLLRLPNTRVVFVSSSPLEPAIVDYYLGLLPGVPLEDVARFLAECDLVKFANLTPTPGRCGAALSAGERLVHATMPVAAPTLPPAPPSPGDGGAP